MQGIATTIRLVDQMTAPIMSINNAINNLIDGFTDVENASDIDTASFDQMRHQVQMANFAAEQLNQSFIIAGDTISQLDDEQNRFNNSLRAGTGFADGLVSKIGAAVAAYASISAIGNVLSLSDEMTQTTARLEMMNDGLQSTQDLQNKIYLAAQRSRGEYQAVADSVSKLGLMAGEAFSSNDEVIAFAEQISKQFVIAGTNTDGAKNAMLQLTQAMASGVLRGDELNSIFEQAPTIIQTIANYLDVPIGTIREMAAEGEITAEIVKAAMLSAAEETNAAFEQMPMTFGQIATSIKNQALMEFQPVLDRLNEIANSPSFQALTDNVIGMIVIVAGVVIGVFDMIAAIAQFASDNWSWLSPTIWTVVAAMFAYITVLTIYNTIQAVSNGIKALAAMREIIHAAAIAMATGATFAQTAAQYGLNAALLACPLTWILLAIIAVIGAIYIAVGVVNHFADTSISATGIILGAFAALGAFLWNLFLAFLELVLGVINFLVNAFVDFANFLANVFVNPTSSAIKIFEAMTDSILALIQKIAAALDFVFGSNLEATVAGWRSNLKGMVETQLANVSGEDYKEVMSRIDLSVDDFGLERWAYSDAFNTGYEAGEKLDAVVSDFFDMSSLSGNTPNASDYGASSFNPDDYAYTGGAGSADPSGVASGIARGVDNIDANTKGQLDYSEEELKLWRDIAERDTINRFTTAEVHVEFGGINNNVSSEMDLDGIVDYIGDNIEETLYEVAKGVHI